MMFICANIFFSNKSFKKDIGYGKIGNKERYT
jgi:hypothetical protein